MKIFHIADIHISKKTNENLIIAFEELKKDMLKAAASDSVVLAVAGDVFDVKGRVEPDDIFTFHRLLEIPFPIIFIAGNHDINPNSLSCPNMIFALCQNINRNDVFVADQPQVIQIEDVHFYCFPFDTIELIPRDPAHQYAVALVHETIEGCCGPLGKPASLYNSFDLVLLGDIHKRQFITPTMAYPGSFTQVKIDEGTDHGYLLWDLESLQAKYVPVHQKYLWIQLRAKRDRIDPFIDLHNQVARRVKIQFESCTPEFMKKTIQQAQEKYGNIEWEDCTKIRDIATPVVEESRELDFLKIIQDAAPENYEKICEMFKERLPDFSYKNRATFKVNYMSWDNLFCYGEKNYMNFEDLGLITGLFAKNATGKSSFCHILQLGIYKSINSVNRTGTYNYVNYNRTSGGVEVQLTSGNEEILLKLTIDAYAIRKKVTPQMFIRKNNISAPTIYESRRLSQSLFGAVANFENINFMSGDAGIIRINESSVRQFLLKLFGLEKIEEAVQDVKKEITEIKREQHQCEGKLATMAELFQKELRNDIPEIESEIQELRRLIEVNSAEIAALNSQVVDHYGILAIRVPDYITAREPPPGFDPSSLIYLKNYQAPADPPAFQAAGPQNGLPEYPFDPNLDPSAQEEPLDSDKEYFIEEKYIRIFKEKGPVNLTEKMRLQLAELEKLDFSQLINPDMIEEPTPPKYHEVDGWPSTTFIPHPGKEPERIPQPRNPGDFPEAGPPEPRKLTKPEPVFDEELEDPKFLQETIPYDPLFEKAEKCDKPIASCDIPPNRPYNPKFEVNISEPAPVKFTHQSLLSSDGELELAPPVNPDPCGKYQEPPSTHVEEADFQTAAPQEPPAYNEAHILSQDTVESLKIKPALRFLHRIIQLQDSCSCCKSNRTLFNKILSFDSRRLELHNAALAAKEKHIEYADKLKKYNNWLAYCYQEQHEKVLKYRHKLSTYKQICEEYKEYRHYLRQKALYDEYLAYRQTQKIYDDYHERLAKWRLWERAEKYRKEQKLLTARQIRYDEYMEQKRSFLTRMDAYMQECEAYHDQLQKYQKYLAKKEYLELLPLYENAEKRHREYRKQLLLHDNCMAKKEYEARLRTYEDRKNRAKDLLRAYQRYQQLLELQELSAIYGQFRHNQIFERNKRIISNRAHLAALHNLEFVKYFQNIFTASCPESVKSSKAALEERSLELRSQIATLTAIKERSEEAIKSTQSVRESLALIQEQHVVFSQFVSIFSSGGKPMNEILSYFMNEIIQQMNETFSNYDIDLLLQLTTSSTDKISLQLSQYEGKFIPLQFASRGQKFMVDLLFRITIIKTNRAPCLRLLLIDESMDCLDMHNREKIHRLISECGVPIILISHSQDIQSKIDKYIQIKQHSHESNVFSQIRYGTEKTIDVKDSFAYNRLDEKEEKARQPEPPPKENIKKEALPEHFQHLGTKSVFCEVCKLELKGGSSSIPRHAASMRHKKELEAKNLKK